ncbi:unnamed protein product, partial [Heterosigma akashiwo]
WQTKESFVGFVHCPDTSGVALQTALVLYLRDKLGLDMTRFRAQGYDGAGNMAGCNIGLQKLMTDMYPLCVYFHCLCHCLNLAINSTCKLSTIATFISTMTTLTLAFKMSPKRQHHLAQELKNPRYNHSNEIGNQEKVATFCETRWTQRSDSMTTFKSALPALDTTFFNLDNLPPNQRDENAIQYRNMINEFSFIIVLCMMEKSFALLLVLCVALQKQEIDMYEAMTQTKTIVKQLGEYKTIRDDDLDVFNAIFKDAVDLAESMDENVEIRIPRNYRRLAGLNNDIDDVKDFYRTRIWEPYLEHLIEQLNTRMVSNEDKLVSLLLVPSPKNLERLSQMGPGDRLKLFAAFRDRADSDLSSATNAQLNTEITQWIERWNRIASGHDGGRVTDLPHSIAATLNSRLVNINLFPNIKTVLLVMGVWPVTTASVERIISLLRRLKPWLRNRMTNERMNSLALMMANPDYEMDFENILRQWKQKHSRNIRLV